MDSFSRRAVGIIQEELFVLFKNSCCPLSDNRAGARVKVICNLSPFLEKDKL